MSEIKKLTPEELQTVKSIRQGYTDLAFALGEIELQKASLEKEKKQLLENQEKIREKEISIAKELNKKYGEGVINTETGEIS